jgi:ribose transport system substrate-binding protein
MKRVLVPTPARARTAKTLRGLTALTIAAAALSGLAACSESEAGSESTDKAKGVIGLVFDAEYDPNQQSIAAGLKKVAEPAGYEITSVNANSDAAAANDLMKTMVTRKVDAIVFITFDADALKSGIAAANEANIPVYAIGSGYGQPEGLTGATRQDGGAEETRTMAEDMGGKGAVLAFTYRAGRPCAVSEQRFDEVMAEYPDIEVTKSDVNSPAAAKWGEDTTAAWLRSHPEGEPLAVWGCHDGPSLGAVVALKAADRKDVKVYGAYGQAEAIQAIRDGNYTATWFYDLKSDGERVAQDIISGEFSLTNPDLYETKTVKVDASNVEQFVKDYPDAIKPQS